MSIYAPLAPYVYSVGGIVLALGMIVVARLYVKLLNIEWFYRASMFVEIVLLGMIIYFLSADFSYTTALAVYLGYQVTFLFGNYLVRAETLFLSETAMLTRIDTVKQLGALLGMGMAYLFYKSFNDTSNIEQVYSMHYLLFIVQIIVIFSVWKSFRR